ncbi:MAG TPA: efflux RND transporter periplasmic adaptor subunit [Pirellulales bacterium]|nr:efflux RND transporter periplasmic adaptor subunit [Pirellulales bacterium]
MRKRVLGILFSVVLVAVCGVAIVLAWPRLARLWSDRSHGHAAQETVAIDAAQVSPYIEVLPRVVELNGIRTAKVTRPTRPRKLELRGQLNFDPDGLMHVHARFPGQIIELSQIEEPNAALSTETVKTMRDISFMDRVLKGRELGVLWSKELGEKKSELVSSLIRLRVDRQNLKLYRQMDKEGTIPPRSLREAEQTVEQDEIAVEKARMTLLSWRLTPQEIEKVAGEAERLHKEQGGRNIPMENEWARVAIVAPRDGTIVEKNVVEGDIVDTDADLFKIADLSRLVVVARVYEEELRYLEQVPRPIPWTITVNSMPGMAPISGYVDRVGDVIDPYEHVALIFGKIENPRGGLFAGQFIKAAIEIPEHPDIVEIPTRALVEDGNESVVLVRVDDEHFRYVARRVLVARRYHDVVRIHSALSEAERESGYEELHEGEEVVAAGALELKAALTQQK